MASYHFGNVEGWIYSLYSLCFSHLGQMGGLRRSTLVLFLRYLSPQVLQVYRRDGRDSVVSWLSVISRSVDRVYRSLLDLRRASTSSPIFWRSPARQLVMLVGWNNLPLSLSSVMSSMLTNCFTRSASLSRCFLILAMTSQGGSS